MPTNRELQVLTLASQGYYDKEIADKLGISCNTVKNIKVTLFKKIGATNITHAVALAYIRGWLKV